MHLHWSECIINDWKYGVWWHWQCDVLCCNDIPTRMWTQFQKPANQPASKAVSQFGLTSRYCFVRTIFIILIPITIFTSLFTFVFLLLFYCVCVYFLFFYINTGSMCSVYTCIMPKAIKDTTKVQPEREKILWNEDGKVIVWVAVWVWKCFVRESVSEWVRAHMYEKVNSIRKPLTTIFEILIKKSFCLEYTRDKCWMIFRDSKHFCIIMVQIFKLIFPFCSSNAAGKVGNVENKYHTHPEWIHETCFFFLFIHLFVCLFVYKVWTKERWKKNRQKRTDRPKDVSWNERNGMNCEYFVYGVGRSVAMVMVAQQRPKRQPLFYLTAKSTVVTWKQNRKKGPLNTACVCVCFYLSLALSLFRFLHSIRSLTFSQWLYSNCFVHVPASTQIHTYDPLESSIHWDY